KEARPRNRVEDVGAPVDQLCPKCEQLHLSTAKFLPDPGENAAGLPGALALKYDPLGMGQCSLGFLADIYRRRSSCSFCWLVFNASYTGKELLDMMVSMVVFRCRQLDGRVIGEKDVYAQHGLTVTRRLRIYNPNDLFPTA
ncbi:hypothetical protein PG996_004263, partial [Apiospora saccharicola]